MLAGTLSGVEMGLMKSKIPFKNSEVKVLFYTFCKCNVRLVLPLETNNNQIFKYCVIDLIIIGTDFNYFLSTSSLIFSMA